jgi:hypothetical protein
MPSPDFSQYIDLTINDKQPDEIYDEAVDYARVALPEFSPRAGTVEDALLQATSYISSLNLGNINRLPDGLMEGVLRYMDILRKEATFGTVSIEYELDEPGGAVPAGTIAVYETTEGDISVQYPFELLGTVTADSASVTVTATARSQVAGILPNIPAGTPLVLSQPSTTVLSATTASAISQGARAETEAEYFNRGTTKLESLSSVLATAKQVEKYILSTYPEVHRCKVYDLTKAVFYDADDEEANLLKVQYDANITVSSEFISNSPSGGLFMVLAPDFYGETDFETIAISGVYSAASANSTTLNYNDVVSSTPAYPVGPVDVLSMESIELGQVGDWPGHFVIFICDQNGSPVYTKTKEDIAIDIANRIPAGLSFRILDAYPVDLNFTVTISVDPEYGAGQVALNAAEDLEQYVSPANWPNWDSVVRIFDLVVRASKVPGVSYVYSVASSVPQYTAPQFAGDIRVRYNNEELVQELNDGGNLLGYAMLYAGILPRASVEVVVV